MDEKVKNITGSIKEDRDIVLLDPYYRSEGRWKNLLILILLFYGIGLTGYHLYSRGEQTAYVIKGGYAYESEKLTTERDESEVQGFIKQFVVLYAQFTKDNYEERRTNLQKLANEDLFENIKLEDLGSELTQSVLNSDLIRVRVEGFEFEKIELSGSVYDVKFRFVRNIITPKEIIPVVLKMTARIGIIQRNKENFFGLVMLRLNGESS